MRILCSTAVAFLSSATLLIGQQTPAVRPLGPVMQVSAEGLLGSVSSVRALPRGGVIVNDITWRQLIVLDAAFNKTVVIADTTPATSNSYSSRMAGLIPFRADSSLFIDTQSLSMLVIDEKGEVSRVMAVPRPSDVIFMIGGPFGTPGLDPQGRIVYRGLVRPRFAGPSGPPEPGQTAGFPVQADTAPILRINLATHALDTAAYIKIPQNNVSMTQDEKGGIRISVLTNPLPVVDDWALMPDGRVAVVRGSDYHVDWVNADGTRTASPKIPFGWERLDDEGKQKLLDSTRAELEKQREAMLRSLQNTVANTNAMMGGAAGSGGTRLEVRTDGPGAPRPQAGVQQVAVPTVNLVGAKELPDYRPAFRQGAARADAEGNVWVRTTTPSSAGAIYDVIDPAGKLVDRVQLPFGRVISGFGPGVVYLGVLDAHGARLERARIRQE